LAHSYEFNWEEQNPRMQKSREWATVDVTRKMTRKSLCTLRTDEKMFWNNKFSNRCIWCNDSKTNPCRTVCSCQSLL